MSVAVDLLELSVLATSAGVSELETQLDLSCIAGTLSDIIDLTKTQALANPRVGLLTHFVDITNDAALLVLTNVEAKAQNTLKNVLATLLNQATTTCSTAPDAGETIARFNSEHLPRRLS